MNPLNAVVARAMADEGSLVHDPPRARHVWRLGVASLVVVLAAASYRIWGEAGGPLDTVTSLVLAGYAGAAALGRMRRAMCYRAGWLDGRMGMLASLNEAHTRDLSLTEWVTGEMERDAHLLGASWEPDQGDGGTQ